MAIFNSLLLNMKPQNFYCGRKPQGDLFVDNRCINVILITNEGLPARVLVCLKARTCESDRPVSREMTVSIMYSS